MSLDIVFVLFGLIFFEAISSLDNAVINADVLRTMSARARRWFLLWGIIVAVFIVRGLLPTVIVWATSPSLGPVGSFFATFSSDPAVSTIVEKSKPVLLIGAGVYLFLLFLHWLFDEKKEYAFFLERFIHRQAIWFYTVASILLALLIWLAVHANPLMAFSAAVGSTGFFLASGFKKGAEEQERKVLGSAASDVSKILYLEMLDASFSVDGVLGAFAFTVSVPLILLGNGIGAFMVRYFTVKGIERVRRYRYLKNGAMYSVGMLGLLMIFESFGEEVAAWIPPLNTFVIVGLFFVLSRRALKQIELVELQRGGS
ncbi:MAG: hypothetical protein A2667_02100 [Candidatus Wildermuthbacteria bacterium RIFCSPHIGHO2_01_FULL_47_27]|uniref:DUF475 domain-containing protein n=2 Tax=Candidatus Wildermuthiibacteriota TaxID=1817923 RepID=A0A1G2RRD5_9BACT|nr:MAG: hypothetical protein A2667_02100 [Candidatus Wildermuthbacteria bacterium RIFCSPHIGHO2_01_FULL_47_27]OHA68970.1 MAG: hypothetical protein A3D59_00845 [Candidatus Wildermuthbacteria bacterium RIFCSPHIGHO2_02_FULL_47_17]OHA75413.1 MAG: hypothetical protein A3A32_00735 [Candidatus Wildermuthbacteria bacterium RIFCSPLOWO2_01_FULL_48_35]